MTIPVLGFSAPSGTGKTTLLQQVIALLQARGVRVGVVKQARDDFDVDQPGKDSYKLRQAGVERLLLSSEQRSALIIERSASWRDAGSGPQLNELLGYFCASELDLILVEGFSAEAMFKIELYRQDGCCSLRYPDDTWVIAIATDEPDLKAAVPVLDLNNPPAIVDFICQRCLFNSQSQRVAT